jgi:hypothetical protein
MQSVASIAKTQPGQTGTNNICHKDTNVSNQLSVISNQFALTDHFSLITVHQ